MNPTLFRVILPVSDIDAAVRFYEGVLDIEAMTVSNGRRYFDCGGTILACHDPRADGDGYDPAPNPEWLYFAVDDLDEAFHASRRLGATMHAGDIDGTPGDRIAVRPWGERSFYCTDPFGNKICFVARSTAYTGPRS